MSTLFLVRSSVSRTPYMGDHGKPQMEIDLVQAASAAEAEEKARAHYESQSSDYGTSVSCDVLSVKAMIA